MFKLIKLELEKSGRNDILTHLISILSITFVIFGLLLLIFFSEGILQSTANFILIDEMMADLPELNYNVLITSLVGLTYLIYGSVNYGRYVVGGIKNKELETLFQYPIKREKILFSKIILAFSFTLIGFVITKLLILLIFSFTSLEISFSVATLFSALLDGLSVAIISMIAMVIGIWRKSVVATIVTGVIVSMFLYGNVGDFTLSAVPIILYIISAVVFVLTFLFINKIKNEDFLN